MESPLTTYLHKRHSSSREPLIARERISATSGRYGSVSILATDTSRLTLKRDLGFFHGMSVAISPVIGSGIFISPSFVVALSGSVALTLIVWCFTGILNLAVAYCYCELATAFPTSGGDYHFLKHGLGPGIAFVYAWISCCIMLTASGAIFLQTATDYALYLVFPSCGLPYSVSMVVNTFILLSVVALNTANVKVTSWVNLVITGAKISGLILIIILGAIQLGTGNTSILATGFSGSKYDFASLVSAVYMRYFTYAGWYSLFFVMDEVKEPEKQIPRITVSSLLCITALYTATNTAYFTTLTPADMMASPAVAIEFVEKSFGKLSYLVPVLVCITCIGSLHATFLVSPRLFYAVARDGLFPKFFHQITISGSVPIVSVFPMCIVIEILVATDSTAVLLEYLGFLSITINALVLFVVIWLRFKQPELHRPFTVPLGITIVVFLVCGALAVFGLVTDPKQYGIGFLIILSGIPVYLFIKWERKPRVFLRMHDWCTRLLQKTFLLVSPDEE